MLNDRIWTVVVCLLATATVAHGQERLTLAEATTLAVDWYRVARTRPAPSMYDVSVDQIRAYETRWAAGR